MLNSPQLNHNGPIPIFQQIKDWMYTQIVSGSWPAHYKLSAEIDLSTSLDVSRGTVRKAISELVEEGLLIRTHGRGTFVANDVLEQPLAERLITFSEDLISKGIPFQTEVLEQKVVQATGRVAAMLSVAAGVNVFILKRVRLVNQEPLIVLHNYVTYDYCPTIESLDFTHYRLFEALETHFNLALDYGQRSFQAQVANEDIAQLLNITEGEAVMHIEQLTHLANGSIIEFSDLWLVGKQFKLSAGVKRNETSNSGLAVSLLQNSS